MAHRTNNPPTFIVIKDLYETSGSLILGRGTILDLPYTMQRLQAMGYVRRLLKSDKLPEPPPYDSLLAYKILQQPAELKNSEVARRLECSKQWVGKVRKAAKALLSKE